MSKKKSHNICGESGNFHRKAFAKFAEENNIKPYIVIGRMMKEEIIRWDCYSNERVRYKWA